ncbi:maleylpyruvate isomerase N-terminal domain-containing protein [Pseudonocardia sp. HH130630-07]|uniref:maleylpyruvate isomerase N-terminal domain-containing protein n=1 Tax=Pseudonocardia sp. HH130630-07 TaxID=1690815 RepID=UPI00081505E0|nr:maleylpyruvate isomerase N-terminal domain-containing protein [Pseudonocardia sp. HH130630-07]ANY05499.1 hypothetical protein AFB00_03345 [Pseudonocardia sp. HH130630-07]
MRAEDVEQATGVMTEVLRGRADADWSAPAGPLTWSCRDTAVHVADDLFGYAAQVAVAPPGDYPPFEITVPAGEPSDRILLVVETGGAMLAAALRTAPPGVRGWHPYGDSDASGFAAMGVTEILVHTHDITRGLGVDWELPAAPCRAVLHRLWPGTDPGPDPASTLLHRTGRAALGAVPPPSSWRWDGTPH